MSFTNATRYTALDAPLLDPSGREMAVVVVKATFDVRPDGKVVRAERGAPVRTTDVMRDPEDPKSSVRYPSDVCLEKRGADVVVVGDAIAKAPVPAVDVAVRVRQRTVPLRVHGERVFYRGATDVLVGPAAPFVRKPILYERAYGGQSADGAVIEHQNPIGVGVAKTKAELVGTPAPQMEHPARPHQSAGDRHPPVGFGAIMPSWSPRAERYGTVGGDWARTRLPLPPPDYDVRYANVAHPSLWFEEPLAEKDAVAIYGMTPAGLFSFEVPAFRVVVHARHDLSGLSSVRPVIDTLLVQPERGRFEIVGRAAFSVGRGLDILRELRVDDDDD